MVSCLFNRKASLTMMNIFVLVLCVAFVAAAPQAEPDVDGDDFELRK